MSGTLVLTKPWTRGAIPSSRAELVADTPRGLDAAMWAPSSFLVWPEQMADCGSDADGDSVTTAKAVGEATAVRQMFLADAMVIEWATAHTGLNGGSPTSVRNAVTTDGSALANVSYHDGPYTSVNWTDDALLQSAIFSHGPVKIGVGAGDFQSNGNGFVTPGKSGWAMYEYAANQSEDHCVSLCGYGSLTKLVALFKTHGVTVTVPNGMPTGLCYAMSTWNSIGIVCAQSMRNMTHEAWIRSPATITARQQRVGGGARAATVHRL